MFRKEKIVIKRPYKGHLSACNHLFLDMVGYIDIFMIILFSYQHSQYIKFLLTQVSEF